MEDPGESEFCAKLQAGPYSLDERWIRVALWLRRRHNIKDDLEDAAGLVLSDAQSMNADPDIMALACKLEWLKLASFVDKQGSSNVSKYAVDRSSSHWAMWIKATTEDVAKAELFGVYPRSTRNWNPEWNWKSDWDLPTKTRNGGSLNLNRMYIVPKLQLSGDEAGTLVPPENLLWTTPERQLPMRRMIVSIMVDEEVWKPYSRYWNNCQQYVQRVCKRLHIKCPRPPITDGSAQPFK